MPDVNGYSLQFVQEVISRGENCQYDGANPGCCTGPVWVYVSGIILSFISLTALSFARRGYYLRSHAPPASPSSSHALLLSGAAPAGRGYGFRTRQKFPRRKLCIQFHPVSEGVSLFPPLLLVHQRDPGLTDWNRVYQVVKHWFFPYLSVGSLSAVSTSVNYITNGVFDQHCWQSNGKYKHNGA